MKTALYIIVGIAIFLYLGGFELSLYPFKISLPFWNRSLGYAFILFGFWLLSDLDHLHGYKQGLRDGRNAVFDELLEMNKKLQKRLNDESTKVI